MPLMIVTESERPFQSPVRVEENSLPSESNRSISPGRDEFAELAGLALAALDVTRGSTIREVDRTRFHERRAGDGTRGVDLPDALAGRFLDAVEAGVV